jgi:hypothetical protein
MRSQYDVKEPVHLWVWFGNILSILAAGVMLSYPRFEKVGRHMTLTLRGGGVILLGLVAISFFVSRFGTRWDDLFSWERALVLPAVCLGFSLLALAVVALLIFLLIFLAKEGGLDFGAFGGGIARKDDSARQARRRRRLRNPQG